jgi:hypothetical protein
LESRRENVRIIGAFLLALCCTTSEASAQTRPLVSLAPPDPARWDVAVGAGARGFNDRERSLGWNQWAHAGLFSASIGRHWTTHLKADVDVAVTPEGRQFVQSTLATADGQTFRVGDRHFRTASLSGSLLYQFGENAWFHPFVGGGVETTRDRSVLTLREQRPCPRVPCEVTLLPERNEVTYETRPFLTGGFKWYVNERAFIRGDARTVWSGTQAEGAVWRVGIGVDF